MRRVGRIIIERIEPPDKVGFLKHWSVIVEPLKVDVDDLLCKLAIAGETHVERLRAEVDRGIGERATIEPAEDPVISVPWRTRVGETGLAS